MPVSTIVYKFYLLPVRCSALFAIAVKLTLALTLKLQLILVVWALRRCKNKISDREMLASKVLEVNWFVRFSVF
jgi:uncharacterized membrane protein